MKTRIFAVLCAAFFSFLSILGILLIEDAYDPALRPLTILGTAPQATLSPADSLLEQARAYIDAAQYDSAEVFLNNATDKYNHSDNKRGLVRTVYERARMLERNRDYKTALELVSENVENSFRWLGEMDLDYAMNLHFQGLLFRRIGEYDVGQEKYFKALRIRKSIPDAPALDIGRSLNNIGVTYVERGLYQKGLEYYQSSLYLRENHLGINHRDVAQSYNNIGNVFKNIGDYGRSLDYHKQSLQIRKKLFGEFHSEVGASYYNIGNVLSLSGHYNSGVAFHKRALKIWNDLYGEKHPYVQISLQAIGLDYKGLGAFGESMEYTRRSLNLQEKYAPGNVANIGDSYLNLGIASSQMGLLGAAEKYYKRSIEFYQKRWMGRHPNIAKSYNALAELAVASNDFRVAHSYLKQAIDANIRVDSSDGLGALSSFYDAKILCKSITVLADLLNKEALSEKGQLRIDYWVGSINEYRRAIKIIHDYRRSFKSESSKFFLTDEIANLLEDSIEVLVNLYRETRSDKHIENIFLIMEHGKSSVLLDELLDEKALEFGGVPDSLISKERELRKNLAFYDWKLKNEEYNQANRDLDLIGKWQRRLFEINQEYDLILEYFEQHYPKYYDLKYRDLQVSIADARAELLEEEDVLVEFFAGRDSLYVLAITRDETALAHGSVAKLDQHIDALRQAIVVQDKKKMAASGHRLYRQLFGGIQDVISKKKHLIIAPHARLNQVPFEVLLTEEAAPGALFRELPYLLKDYSITYINSATLEVHTQKSAGKPGWTKDFVAFAPVFEDGIDPESAGVSLLSGRRGHREPVHFELDGETVSFFAEDSTFDKSVLPAAGGYLPNSLKEVEEIQDLFRQSYSFTDRFLGGKARIYVHEKASESRLKSLDLTGHRFVHFATHGVVNDSIPELSGILLAEGNGGTEDGVLSLGEIYNLELDAELVVLSACETGLGKLAGGEGIIGLARGFKYAGANALLVSLWSVDDASTRLLMRSFYEHLLAGKSKAEAIRQAKLHLIDNTLFFASPFYWAGFVLIGAG